MASLHFVDNRSRRTVRDYWSTFVWSRRSCASCSFLCTLCNLLIHLFTYSLRRRKLEARKIADSRVGLRNRRKQRAFYVDGGHWRVGTTAYASTELGKTADGPW